MSFLPPNQQCQSTEGIYSIYKSASNNKNSSKFVKNSWFRLNGTSAAHRRRRWVSQCETVFDLVYHDAVRAEAFYRYLSSFLPVQHKRTTAMQSISYSLNSPRPPMFQNTYGISKYRLSPYMSTISITNITFYLMFPVPTAIYFFGLKSFSVVHCMQLSGNTFNESRILLEKSMLPYIQSTCVRAL